MVHNQFVVFQLILLRHLYLKYNYANRCDLVNLIPALKLKLPLRNSVESLWSLEFLCTNLYHQAIQQQNTVLFVAKLDLIDCDFQERLI